MTAETAETFTCPACGVSGLTLIELRQSEITGDWQPVDISEAIPPEHRQHFGEALVCAVQVNTKCLWCDAAN